MISIEQRHRKHGFSRHKLTEYQDELLFGQYPANDQRRLVVLALLEVVQRLHLVVDTASRVRLDIRLLLLAEREELEGRHDQHGDPLGGVRDYHANSYAEGAGAEGDSKSERQPARPGQVDAGRLDDDPEIDERSAAVLLDRRRDRCPHVVLSINAVGFTEKHLLLRGSAVAGVLFQGAVLHRDFPADQRRVAVQ